MTRPYSAESLLDGVLSACPCPILAADRDGRILEYSAAAEALLGYSAADVRRDLIAQDLFSDAQDIPQLIEALQADPAGETLKRRVRLRAQDGEAIPTHLFVRWVGDAIPGAWVAVIEDTRESADLEARLFRATDQLIASEKRSTTMKVAGAAAHNLNQPLTSIMGSVELLANRRDLPPDVRRRVHRIYDQLERMARAVHELSTIRKYQTAPYVGDTQILDLSQDD